MGVASVCGEHENNSYFTNLFVLPYPIHHTVEIQHRIQHGVLSLRKNRH